jgi:hypothetical protein
MLINRVTDGKDFNKTDDVPPMQKSEYCGIILIPEGQCSWVANILLVPMDVNSCVTKNIVKEI